MALNKYMHERNPYKQRKPDFQALAVKYDYFREKVTQATSGKIILDFKDPGALRVLTRALLEDDFGISVDLPLDRLIPMVPQRLNYILWLEDIVGQTDRKTDHTIRGIDIGTGASCIFPLLGCRQNGWQFVASEVDEQNVYFAQKNIEKNKMQDSIKIKKVTEDTILSGFLDNDDDAEYDFCMCNPPFYTDHLEAQGITSSRSDDRPEPSSVSTASETESIAWGGEVRFVSRMIDESLILKEKIRVYTSMLGKKMSLSLLKDELVKKEIPKFSTTEFCQGKTMRWGIAWTFDTSVNFPKSAFKTQKNVKPPLDYEVPRSSRVVTDYTVQAFTHFIKLELDQLKIHYYIKHSGKFYTGLVLKATENNWSHQRRKRRERKRRSNTDNTQSHPDSASDTTPDKLNVDKDDTGICKGTESSQSSPDKLNDSGAGLGEGNTKVEAAKTSAAGTADTEVQDTKGDGAQVTSSSDETVSTTAEPMDTAAESPDKNGQVESKKRLLDDAESGNESKKFKTDTESEAKGDEKSEEKPIDLEAAWIKASTVPPETDSTAGNQNKDGSALMNRADIVKQFWKEQEVNSGKKTVQKSPYQSLEPFKEDEECLVKCKLELRKEEGVVRMVITYLCGNKETLAQIHQYFKNRISTGKCEYGAG